jgi:dimethylamine monooxygenase subunit A
MSKAPPYFPVTDPHHMPGMQPRLGDARVGTACFERDDEADEYLTEKRRLWSGRRPSSPDAPEARATLQWLRETIGAEHPDIAARFATVTTLDEAMLGVQEDLVIMRREHDAEPATATAVYLHVSFPTSWCPECARGRTFLELHEPVPALHAFKAANRQRLAPSLFDTRRTTARFVWSLAPDSRLDRPRCPAGLHPTVTTRWDDATTAWLRVERQVIVPLDDLVSLFLIRVYRSDVRHLTSAQRATLHRSVAGMDPALAEYKGFAASMERILALLALDS